MKMLVLDPDFYKSALLMDNGKRCFNHCIVAKKLLQIFETQPNNNFCTVPNYRVWKNHTDALKLYFNCLLRVVKEVHGFNTKYQYFTDIPDKITYPNFTDLTFKSHQAFCIELDYDLYIGKFLDSKDFNGGTLIWEFDITRGDEKVHIAEDRYGVFKPEKLLEKHRVEFKEYNMEESNELNKDIHTDNFISSLKKN